jgi:predicted Zn finger-like uncharacterized protein
MEVSCPACAARYTADGDKLRGKTARMRCKACNTVWLVSGSDAPPPADVPPVSLALDKAGPPGSKRAAVVKRGAEREKRDLFAKREEEAPVSSMRPSDAPPPSFGFSGGGVGARNENSVLFRVDQLARDAGCRAKTEPVPAIRVNERVDERANEPGPPSSIESRSPDDEGVIDLKALSSSGAPRPLGAPVAPLFSEPPPVTLELGASARPNARPTSKLAIAGGIVGGIAFLAAAIFGLSIAFRSEEPVKHTAAVVAAAPPPVTAAPAATPTPAPSASADARDPKDAKQTKKSRRGKSRGVNASAAGATPSKPKASDPCGCHGDFTCVLGCSAKGKM